MTWPDANRNPSGSTSSRAGLEMNVSSSFLTDCTGLIIPCAHMAGLPPYPPQGTQNAYGFSNDPNQPNMGGIPQMPPVQMQGPQPGNGMGVAGMVLGIIALVLFWVPFLDVVLAILA